MNSEWKYQFKNYGVKIYSQFKIFLKKNWSVSTFLTPQFFGFIIIIILFLTLQFLTKTEILTSS